MTSPGEQSRTTPDPTSAQHCFAVVFSSQHATQSPAGYEESAEAMVELAKKQPGFLGVESARNPDGFGITVSYWESLEAIAQWRAQTDHQKMQGRGRESFYSRYEVRVCSVVRAYKFPPST
jgi:heme-degrading monooxygenase HmoA